MGAPTLTDNNYNKGRPFARDSGGQSSHLKGEPLATRPASNQGTGSGRLTRKGKLQRTSSEVDEPTRTRFGCLF